MHSSGMRRRCRHALAPDRSILRSSIGMGISEVSETISDKIDILREEVVVLTQAVVGLQNQTRLVAEHLNRLVDLVTPEEKEGGNQLAITLAHLAQEVEHQNRVLSDVSSTLVRFVREMPAMIAESVTGATAGLLASVRDLPGRVLTAVRDALS